MSDKERSEYDFAGSALDEAEKFGQSTVDAVADLLNPFSSGDSSSSKDHDDDD